MKSISRKRTIHIRIMRAYRVNGKAWDINISRRKRSSSIRKAKAVSNQVEVFSTSTI